MKDKAKGMQAKHVERVNLATQISSSPLLPKKYKVHNQVDTKGKTSNNNLINVNIYIMSYLSKHGIFTQARPYSVKHGLAIP